MRSLSLLLLSLASFTLMSVSYQPSAQAGIVISPTSIEDLEAMEEEANYQAFTDLLYGNAPQIGYTVRLGWITAADDAFESRHTEVSERIGDAIAYTGGNNYFLNGIISAFESDMDDHEDNLDYYEGQFYAHIVTCGLYAYNSEYASATTSLQDVYDSMYQLKLTLDAMKDTCDQMYDALETYIAP
jgi:hypothetical protein